MPVPSMEDFPLFDGLPAIGDGGLGYLADEMTLLGDLAWDSVGTTFVPANPPTSTTTNIPTCTVSPMDLVLSCPPSTAFTNLTSPSLQDSPLDNPESYEASPLFSAEDILGSALSSFPLFSDATLDAKESLQRSISTSSFACSSGDSLSISCHLKPSADNSPRSGGAATKHSSASGIKSRRRAKPLAPILYDPSDKVALKRARNTESARQSRQRRYEWEERMTELLSRREAEVEALRKDTDRWKQIAISLGYTESTP